MRRKFLLVSNAQAGTFLPSVLPVVKRLMHDAGASLVEATEADFQAQAGCKAGVVAERAFEAIILAGGDGLIRRSASVAMSVGLPIGIVPVGTGNVFATEIGLSQRPREIVESLLHGRTRPVRINRANDLPFLLMAGIGFDAEVVGALNPRLKRLIGKGAYVPATLTALRRRREPLSVELDGVRREAHWVLIAGAQRYAGRFRLHPELSIWKGELTAFLFSTPNPRMLVAQLWDLARGRLHLRRDVDCVPCQEVRIEGGCRARLQLDGDDCGTTPVWVRAGSDIVQVIAGGAV